MCGGASEDYYEHHFVFLKSVIGLVSERVKMYQRRDVVRRYGQEIEKFTKQVRQRLEGDKEKSERDDEEIHREIEDLCFLSFTASSIVISDLPFVIEEIYERVAFPYTILTPFLDDASVNEIMVNGPDSVFIERGGYIEEVDRAFYSEQEVEDLIRMFAQDVHREVNESHPIVDARLPSGYRVNGVLKAVALNGPILTIRKFSGHRITMKDLVEFGSITEECAAFLTELAASGYNIFVSGGTSSGKTTLLNALADAVDDSERVIIIEDSAELSFPHLKNIVHLECKNANSIGKGEVTMTDLIKSSLRMRPDRIIVGEVRGKEVIDMIQAMSTGHDGSMSTGHGNSIKGMLQRLATMYTMGSKIPLVSIERQIANSIDIFVHLHRDSKGARKVVEVAELIGYEKDEYILRYLFQTENEKLVRTEEKLTNREKLLRYREMKGASGVNDL